ncbi:MAG: hypothetical protein KIT75_14175, partial [Planctomycetota bacterium]|nr:hypothetical protein [Planctomycetota bacterium]
MFRHPSLAALAAVVVLFATVAFAQTTIGLGASTTTGNVIPFNLSGSPWGESGRYQTAYSGAEINLASGGTVTEIRVRSISGSPTTYGNFRLRLAHTQSNPTALSGTFAQNFIGSLTTVIGDSGTSNPLNYQPSTIVVGSETWVRFPLTNGWTYNGTDGILVDWSFDSMAAAGFSIGSVATRSRVYAYATGANSYQVATGTSSNGAGNWQIQFIVQVGPILTVATTPGAAQNVYANDTGTGGNGRSVTRFTIAQGTQTGASLTNIQVQAAGTGDDSTAYTEVAIYRDDNSNNTFDFGTDVLIASHTAFPANNGTRDFAVTGSESTFTASQTKTYFLVVKLNGSPPASPGHTFNYVVSDITVSGTNAQKAGVPSGTINGLNILTPSFNFADVSPATATTVFLGSSNNVCQAFTIAYPNGPADKPASVTVTGLGSAHEVDD